MDIGTILGWGLGTGLFTWLALSILALGTRIFGWAYRVVEDVPKGQHVNVLERMFMERLGFGRKGGKWVIDRSDLPSLVFHGDYSYRYDEKEGYFMPTALTWAFLSWIAVLLIALCIVIWKVTLPIALFFAAVYLLRYLRRKAKEKAMKDLEEGSAEQDKETSPKDLA